MKTKSINVCACVRSDDGDCSARTCWHRDKDVSWDSNRWRRTDGGCHLAVEGQNQAWRGTDLDGHYTLQGVNAGTILVFSYVGYDTAERMVGEKSTIDIVLKQSAENLNEVVVVGYGTMKKSDLTGSVSQLKAENFKAGNELSAQHSCRVPFCPV
jgi:hypothetical protein